MPMWCPPTPPQDDNDVYKDYSLTFLYDPEMIPETQLPPVYIKKEYKRNRIEAGFYSDGRRPLKIRKEDNYYPPRSLFDRPSPAIAKMRRDLKLQRYRGIFKPTVQLPGLKQQTLPMKPLIEPEGMAEWFIYEDMAILNVIQNLQGLPLNLMFLSPGHTPNWDLVADIVNQSSRIHRSAKQCRYRYEAVIVPREEGKLLESPKKQKKNKNPMKLSLKGVRSMRTAQSYINDNNTSFTKLVKLKFENIRTAYLNKAPLLKQILVNPSLRNPKHAAVLQDFGITNYESPPTPVEIATRRQERITKDKQKLPVLQVNDLAQSQTVGTQQQHQQQQQQQIQQPSTTIVVQQQQQQQQLQNSSPITTIVQTAQQTAVRPTVTSITIPQQQQTQQIVKAIVATPTSTNLVSNTLHQQLAISNQSQQLQLTTQSQQQQQQQQVSVVLTTPITTISSIQQQQLQQSNQTQIVSIHQNINNNTIVTQTTSLMQTLPTQSMPQVVSVSQLASVGAVISTAGLQSNQNVATLTSSPLRAQRIVTTPGGLQEVVLHPRSGSQSPTVVSVSSLGQGLTQAQLQAAQLRLQMSAGQQVQGVVAKGIQVSTLQNAGKPANTSIFYRQNVRQQFKVLHTTPGQGATVVQTAGGQATLVSPGTIIQGGIVQQANVGQTVQVQSATGQKMSVATIGGVNNATGVVTSVATVQVAPGQARTQFIKHVGKQTIARQVSESEVQALMIKRQLLNQQHKVQQGGVQQTQIFAPTSVQLQQPGTSGQQIATLVKTAGGVTAATLSQVKAGQIKATMANPNQVRQLQLQQQLALQRKGGKMTQFTHVAGKGGVPTQLIVQNPKVLPGTVTVQQIQQVIRHAQPGQIVLGKTGVSRVIPGNVAQANARQTIQVLTATSAAGNIRHVAGTQNITGLQGTIKVTSSGATVQQQQALLNALQNQHQRQNPSPVRIQTTQGSLVAVTLQQQQQQQQQQPTTTVVSVSSAQQQQQQQQNTTNTQHDVISNVTSTTLHNQQTQQSQQQTQQQQQQQNQQVVQKYFVIP